MENIMMNLWKMVLILLLWTVPFSSIAELRRFKYFQVNLPDGWVAEEQDGGSYIQVTPEDVVHDGKGNVYPENLFITGFFHPSDEKSLEESAEKFIAGIKVKNNNINISIDHNNNIVLFSYFYEMDEDVSAMMRSASMHTVPSPVAHPVQMARLERYAIGDGRSNGRIFYSYKCNGKYFNVIYAPEIMGHYLTAMGLGGIDGSADLTKDDLARRYCQARR
jgi:hypothetical protein